MARTRRGTAIRKLKLHRVAPHIVLISIDTCRADRLGCYGFDRNSSPNIDAFAAEGILFENAYCPVPLTIPSHSTMLTGTNPPYHGVRGNNGYRLDDSHLTLAETLKENGYRTGAFIGEFVLDAQFGLAQGFDTYHDDFPGKREQHFLRERRAMETTELAIEWLREQADEPFLLFLHYFDPHDPYIPPEPFASRFKSEPYVGEIAYTDHCIGALINQLKEQGIYDSSLIVITADHGEGLGEHDELTHGYFIYNSTVRVPLIVKLPHAARPQRIGETVGLVDILPTILGQAGIEVPSHVVGQDLANLFSDRADAGWQPRPYYCECLFPTSLGCSSLRGVVSGGWKYIRTTRPELYDLASDPGETTNVLSQHADRVDLMEKELDTLLSVRSDAIASNSHFMPDEETTHRLQSLGYVGGISEQTETDTDKDDPKDFITIFNQVAEMLHRREDGRDDEAKELCLAILQQRPGIGIIHSVLAQIHEQEGDLAFAQEHYEEALAGTGGNPAENALHLVKLARLHLRRGQITEAIALATDAVRTYPEYAQTHCCLGTAVGRSGNHTGSIDHFRAAIRVNPNDADAYVLLADALVRLGQTDEAFSAYRVAMGLKPDWDWPAIRLAWILATPGNENLGTPAEAVRLAQRACEKTDSENPQYLHVLSLAYAAAGQNADAVETAQQALELARAQDKDQLVETIERDLQRFRQQR